MTSFAGLVKGRMAELGLGLRELCRAAELDPSFFSKVLAEKRSPPAEEEALRKLALALRLEAPRLIVAAGRIPSEWAARLGEEGVFRAVHALATGAAAAPARSTADRWGRRPGPVAPRPAEFGEELL